MAHIILPLNSIDLVINPIYQNPGNIHVNA